MSEKVKPHRFGWLRRPELDRWGFEIWEKPSGELYEHNPKHGPLMLDAKRPPKKSHEPS